MGGDGEVDQFEPDLMMTNTSFVYVDPSLALWLEIARLAGVYNGTCARRNVGAVLVANGRFRELGWNGMERSDASQTCMGGGCPRGLLTAEEQPHGSGYSNCVYLHAEFNAAENYRHSVRARNVEGWANGMGVTIYSSSNPCEDCLRYASWAGITLVWNGRGNGNKASTGQDSDGAGVHSL